MTEQRLIDANALIDDIKNNLWDWETVDGITATTVLKQTISDIGNQPIIEERKKGKWIWDDEMGVFLCSSCKNGWKDQPTLMGKPLFEWCPVCGAEMEVEE